VAAGGGESASLTLVWVITVIVLLSTVAYVRAGAAQLPSRRAA